MPDPDLRYSLTELAGLSGVTPRTVRFYLSQGLLPSPGTTGPGVRYGNEHLDRLRLIRRLQREHLPLGEIRSRLSGLDGGQIAQLAGVGSTWDSSTEPEANAPDTALDYVRRLLEPSQPVRHSLLKRMAIGEASSPLLNESARPMRSVPSPPQDSVGPAGIARSQWERLVLTADVELHVRRPLSRHMSKKVDRLLSIARELLEEDPS
jgi:DNA-binding transcriptional MerR regulator